ncbi:MAG TPA: NfeD family protein [bacterium]|jgi:membrane protein implicated in regulation of membrane protease activity|nr:NfeD family protein [bacterium]
MQLLMDPVSFWWPLGLGLLLMTGELFAPSTVFLWTGAAGVLVALPMVLWPSLPLVADLGLWLLFSLAAVLAARRYHRGHPLSGERVGLSPSASPNRYGTEFIGMSTVLKADSQGGETRVSLQGASWGVKLKGGDLKAGSRIRVVGLDGIFLVAEPADVDRAGPESGTA